MRSFETAEKAMKKWRLKSYWSADILSDSLLFNDPNK